MQADSMSFSGGAPERAAPADDDLELLFHPSRRFGRPADVLVDPNLSVGEARAVLASWASDACAVDSAPALRRAPFGAEPVTFDEIMDALLKLDRRRSPPLGSKRVLAADAPPGLTT